MFARILPSLFLLMLASWSTRLPLYLLKLHHQSHRYHPFVRQLLFFNWALLLILPFSYSNLFPIFTKSSFLTLPNSSYSTVFIFLSIWFAETFCQYPFSKILIYLTTRISYIIVEGKISILTYKFQYLSWIFKIIFQHEKEKSETMTHARNRIFHIEQQRLHQICK